MDKVSGTFTVIFENPFWIGIFESESKKTIRRIKIFLETKEEKRKTQSSLILIYMQWS